MTVEEFWEFVHRPENEHRSLHLIRGEVVEDARPARPHGVVTAQLGSLLEQYARHVRCGYVVVAAGVILSKTPASVVGPDVAYFNDANTFDDLHPKWGDVPPVLAVEVMSPNDRPNALITKVSEYLASGVKIVWLVDYEDRNVSVFRPNTNPVVVREGGELTGGDDLPGLAIKVADIFKLPGDRQLPSSATSPSGS